MPQAAIVMQGHILDSLLLPKVLDIIVASGAEYEIQEITIGRTRRDASHARILISAPDEAGLQIVLAETLQHGAEQEP